MLYANRLLFVPRAIAELLMFTCYIFLLMALVMVRWINPKNNGKTFLYKQGKKIHDKVIELDVD